MPFRHLLSTFSNSRYFEQCFIPLRVKIAEFNCTTYVGTWHRNVYFFGIAIGRHSVRSSIFFLLPVSLLRFTPIWSVQYLYNSQNRFSFDYSKSIWQLARENCNWKKQVTESELSMNITTLRHNTVSQHSVTTLCHNIASQHCVTTLQSSKEKNIWFDCKIPVVQPKIRNRVHCFLFFCLIFLTKCLASLTI